MDCRFVASLTKQVKDVFQVLHLYLEAAAAIQITQSKELSTQPKQKKSIRETAGILEEALSTVQGTLIEKQGIYELYST